jgi:hypothetical protein
MTAHIEGRVDPCFPAFLEDGKRKIRLRGGFSPRKGNASSGILIKADIPLDLAHDLLRG